MTKTFLVTGAAGYLASWVVQQLLRDGHAVHGTVRSIKDAAKLHHLHDLAKKHPGQFTLFEADLQRPGSFDAAMNGCSSVIHTASPYFVHKPKDIQRELIQPALDGTRDVLASVARTHSVTRVVLTSSIAALYGDARDLAEVPDRTVREQSINPNQDPGRNSYAYSKTVAERAAWDEQRKQQRWDLITIHPGAIFGPSLSRRTDATSVDMMVQFLNGSFRTGVPRLMLGLVDVRDAAQAHVTAALSSQARGRYIVVGESLRLLEMAKLMRVKDFGLVDKLPRGEAPKALLWLIAPFVGLQRDYVARNVGHDIHFDSSRSRTELGLHYRGAAETLNDHIRQLVQDKLV